MDELCLRDENGLQLLPPMNRRPASTKNVCRGRSKSATTSTCVFEPFAPRPRLSIFPLRPYGKRTGAIVRHTLSSILQRISNVRESFSSCRSLLVCCDFSRTLPCDIYVTIPLLCFVLLMIHVMVSCIALSNPSCLPHAISTPKATTPSPKSKFTNTPTPAFPPTTTQPYNHPQLKTTSMNTLKNIPSI